MTPSADARGPVACEYSWRNLASITPKPDGDASVMKQVSAQGCFQSTVMSGNRSAMMRHSVAADRQSRVWKWYRSLTKA
jgi:hypothetical protein